MIDPIGGEPRELDQGRQIRFVVMPTGVRWRTPSSDEVPR